MVHQIVIGLTVLVAALSVVPRDGRADLMEMDLDAFLSASPIIIHARPVETTDRPGEGKATLKPIQVIRGDYTAPSIQITWSAEEHDSPIFSKREYVLFLSSVTPRATAAAYGRSYWPVMKVASDLCAIYQWPVTAVRVPKSLRDTRQLVPDGPTHEVVCLGHILAPN